MIDGRFQLSSREYSFFNKRNPEIYLKGVDYKKNSISLATFNALEHTEISVIPLTFESLEKEIKRKKYLKYYNVKFLESFFYVYPLSKTDVTHYNNIAYYLQKAGSNQEAVYLLEKILEKFPKRMVAYYNLGDAYWALGEKKKARASYKTYMKMMKAKGKEKRIPQVVEARVLGN